MDIVILGAGEVGRHSAEVLGSAGHNITLVDRNRAKLALVEDEMDIRILRGSGLDAQTMREAGVDNADLFLGVTHLDETNMLSAAIAKGMGCGKVIARVHHSRYFEGQGFDYARQLGIDHMVCPDHTTATTIAQGLRSPGALAVERFAGGRIEIQELAVDDSAALIGHSLSEARLPTSTRLAAISREGESFIPDARTVIQAGDVVTLIGDSEHFQKARGLFQPSPPSRFRVIIMGGTALGVWLCRALHHHRFTVKLFEEDMRRCRQLAEKLEWVTILHADATGQTILEEEHIEQVDAFVALTDDDERNILASARAKSMGVRHAISVLQRPTYLHLIEHVGIDRAYSPRITAVTEIQNLIDVSPVRKLASLAAGIADVYQVRVHDQSPMLDKPLKMIKFPVHCMVAAIQRGERTFVPNAEDSFEGGDTLILIGPSGMHRPLRKLFGIRE
ncbi:MAG: Trk system potassium transporter TrkA [Phycisphaeraceae bacterium]|nr:Trk system potassium transporter TrkA [Phycisphaeraceae bacterium]